MKHLAIIGFILLSFSASAQKANFRSMNAKQEAGIHTRFNCVLTETASAEQVQELVTKMKAIPGVLKLDIINPTATSAELIIITKRENDVAVLKSALAAAGLSTVYFDEKKTKTTNLDKVITNKN